MTAPQLFARSWPFMALAVIGYLDYITGPLLPLLPLYVLVVVAVSWRRPLREAIGLGIVAAAIVYGADLASAPPRWTTLHPYWRGIGHLVSFGVIVFAITHLSAKQRRLAESERQLLRQRQDLNELNTTLVQALEDRAAEREGAIEALVRHHTSEVRNLREVVEQFCLIDRQRSNRS